MSSDPDLDTSLSVTEGPVTVTKSFEAEEFPVPAIKFVVASTATESVAIRLTDSIPESFPMENVGFHPDFEKDNWTAYKSHRVEYERTLDPSETTTTVYGVRLEGADPSTFLTEPAVSFPDDEAVDGDARGGIDDVLGEDSNQIVRDVLSGERDSLPGLDDSEGVDAPGLTPDAGVDVDSSVDSGSSVDADSAVDADPETADDADDGPTEDIQLDLDEDAEDEGVADADAEADAVDEDAEDAENEAVDEESGDDADDEDAPVLDLDVPSPHRFDASGDSATEHTDDAVVDAVGGLGARRGRRGVRRRRRG
ncbi:hypothetical protein [Salinigranum sp. GCM10025319]|uniref:hypothetical protein n=1 Tax=Salinigranum sp. GCM10025319 TaxID=3252687 RepID=UPI00360E15B2